MGNKQFFFGIWNANCINCIIYLIYLSQTWGICNGNGVNFWTTTSCHLFEVKHQRPVRSMWVLWSRWVVKTVTWYTLPIWLFWELWGSRGLNQTFFGLSILGRCESGPIIFWSAEIWVFKSCGESFGCLIFVADSHDFIPELFQHGPEFKDTASLHVQRFRTLQRTALGVEGFFPDTDDNQSQQHI